MEYKRVTGQNKGKITLYALSTCIWCKKTKKLLTDLGIEFSYVDVDLLDATEETKVVQEINKWNPRGSFPTLVINDERCILGYDEAKIKELAKS
jgi:glutaredoxin-like protein NrdH